MSSDADASDGRQGQFGPVAVALGSTVTAGQRWTAALCLVVAGVVVAFGAPKVHPQVTGPAAYGGAPAPPLPPAPSVAAPTSAAMPALSTPPAGAAGSAVPMNSASAPVAAGPSRPSPPPPSAPPGPCQVDTGLPVPVARTLVDAVVSVDTALAALAGRPLPADPAVLLGSLTGCPSPR